MKKIWLTALDDSKENQQKFMASIKSYGLSVEGHFWKDDLMKWAWVGPRNFLTDPETALWVILGSAERLISPETRYGLSLLCLSVQARRGSGFPVVIVQTTDSAIASESLPTALKGAELLTLKSPALGPKLTAKVHAPAKTLTAGYRLDILGNEHVGQWFEAGPEEGSWQGAVFGVSGAEIVFHAVGKKGELPKTAQLNYPSKGMKIALGEKEYLAWGVQNEIDASSSYYVKVMGSPQAVLFGSYPTEESAELYITQLT